MVSKRVISDVFNKVSEKYDLFLDLVTLGLINRWQKTLISMLSEEGNRLDIGTGTGEVLVKSNNRGLKVGIDLAKGMLIKAKKKCKECYFVLADAENLPFKEGSFNTITLSLVYRHLLNKEAFLSEANRVLKPGGQIGILDLSKSKMTYPLFILFKYILKPLGVLLFGPDKWEFFVHSIENSLSKEELARETKKFGFELVDYKESFFGLVMFAVFKKPS